MNPERPWPTLDRLRAVTAAAGFTLRERLTVHPEYVRAGEPWIDPRLSAARGGAGRRRRAGPRRRTPGRAALAGAGRRVHRHGTGTGRTDLHATIDTEGRTADRRDDFDSVYGDWDALRRSGGRAPGASASERPKPPRRWSRRRCAPATAGELTAALAAAERDPAGLSDEQALLLMTAEGPALDAGLRDRGRRCAATWSATT